MTVTNNSNSVAVLGAGSFGTALAIHLADSCPRVNLWGHNPEQMRSMAAERENKSHLPGFALPDNIKVEDDLAATLSGIDLVLIVIPSQGIRGLVRQIRPILEPGAAVFWTSKGFELETGKLLHQVLEEELPEHAHGVFSGPTFASEVAAHQPAAIVCAGSDPAATGRFAALMHGGYFRCYISEDVVGVELGGALKNVLAIAVGIADGIGFGANTRAALITRGLAEIMRLAVRMGAEQETMMGLAGLGDLILTCTDDQSRNRRFGLALGRGLSVEDAIESVGQTVEGYRAARAVSEKARALDVEIPIMQEVYDILYEDKPPLQAVRELESRPPKAEH